MRWAFIKQVGNFIPKESIANPESLQIWLKVNGKLRQEGKQRFFFIKITLS